MPFIVIMTPRAKRAAKYIGAWWRNHRLEAPSHFDEDLDQVLAGLREHPERGFSQPRGRRALVTARTKHVVVYKVRPRARRVEVVWIRSP